MKLSKSAGTFPLDLDDGHGERVIDAFLVQEHLTNVYRAEKAARKVKELADREVMPIAFASFFDQPVEDWPPHRAQAFYTCVSSVIDDLKKPISG
jgi:hypothetical protein